MAEGRACTASKETEDFMSHQRGIKRTRTGFGSTESPEPDIKRSSFKLQPAILIHGQTKSQSKGSDPSEKASNKCKFLQPSKLQAPPSFRTEQSAHSSSSSGDLPAQTGTNTFVSSCNPFLMANNAEDEEAEDTTDEVSSETKATEEKKATGKEDGKNTAAASNGGTDLAAKKESGKSDKSEFGTSTFGAKPSSSGTSGFVFGQNFSERAKGGAEGSEPAATTSTFSLAKKPTFSSPTKAKPVEFGDGAKTIPDVSAKTAESAASLEANAAAHFAAAESRDVIPEVEVRTGEEDEKNVLMIQCKLYQFNASNSNWVERGMGNLHLNDHKFTGVDGHFQSRLVMRAHGSLRLVLNTKIWSGMTVERASKKSIRVSAQCGEEIGVFLVSTTINDAEQIYRALEYRILHQKQWDEDHPDKSAPAASAGPTKSEDDTAGDKNDNSEKEDGAKSAVPETTSPTKSADAEKNDENHNNDSAKPETATSKTEAEKVTTTTKKTDSSDCNNKTSSDPSSESSSSNDAKIAPKVSSCNSNGDSND